jgi:FtsZ-binding cell division protein ZapB
MFMKINEDTFKSSKLDDEVLAKLAGIPNVVKAMKMKPPSFDQEITQQVIDEFFEYLVVQAKASKEATTFLCAEVKQLIIDNEKLAAEKQMLLAGINVLKKTNETLREANTISRENSARWRRMYEATRELVTPVKMFLDSEASVADLRIGFEACQEKVAKLE